MSVSTERRNGYGSAARSMGTPRSIEYQVFSQTTGRLRRASEEQADFSDYAAALQENLRLWSVIATDVANEANQLPDMLRAQLFYLYEFTNAETQKALRRETDAQALIDINTAVMRGLRGDGALSEA